MFPFSGSLPFFVLARSLLLLVSYWLVQVGIAIQLSHALGRELILPPMWCGLEFGWMQHNGRAEAAAAYRLPAICPAARIFDLSTYAVSMSRLGSM